MQYQEPVTQYQQLVTQYQQPVMQYQQGRVANPNVTCYKCDMRGHYSTTCTNPALSPVEQRNIQEQVMAQTFDYRARIVASVAMPLVIHPSQSGTSASLPQNVIPPESFGVSSLQNSGSQISGPFRSAVALPISR